MKKFILVASLLLAGLTARPCDCCQFEGTTFTNAVKKVIAESDSNAVAPEIEIEGVSSNMSASGQVQEPLSQNRYVKFLKMFFIIISFGVIVFIVVLYCLDLIRKRKGQKRNFSLVFAIFSFSYIALLMMVIFNEAVSLDICIAIFTSLATTFMTSYLVRKDAENLNKQNNDE